MEASGIRRPGVGSSEKIGVTNRIGRSLCAHSPAPDSGDLIRSKEAVAEIARAKTAG
jgi:hypothetical protein